jgi:ABC-type spermidine/putrescine transport system permease subunit I
LLLAPALVAVGVLFLLPLGRLVSIATGFPDPRLDAFRDLVATAGFGDVLLRTIRITALVTLVCVAIGFPIAYLMSRSSPRMKTIVAILVILPFWTSILVRNYAWIYLLQRRGIVNGLLMDLGLIGSPIDIIYNEVGVVIAMSNALLPFMVLPIFVALEGQDRSLLEASQSLGARPARTFLDVTLPLSLSGIVAGSLIVFATGLGFYVTPALLGGGRVLLAATFITKEIEVTLNWPMAAAASLILLATVVGLMAAYARLVGIDRLAGSKP